MNDEHKKIVEDLYQKMSDSLTKGLSVTPSIFLILPGGQLAPTVTPNGEQISLTDYINASIDAAAEMNAEALILCVEQYMVRKDKESFDASMFTGSLEEHPDKEECLSLMHIDASGNRNILLSKIHTDIKGTKYTLNYEWIDSDNIIKGVDYEL